MPDELISASAPAPAPEAPIAAPAPAIDISRPLEPTQLTERITLIDVLRGLALFGIIAANMRGFAGPLHAYFRPELIWNTRLDFWTQAFVDTFIQGKFITIFAFLFGVGFAVQFSRAEERHGRFVAVYRRRLFALILIGLLHQLLFWWGDILVSYGLGGFLLILFRKRKNKTILIWALVLMTLPILGAGGYVAFRHFRPPSAAKAEASQKKAQQEKLKSEAEMRDAIHIYQTGSYAQIYNTRLGELWRENRSQPAVVFMTLPLFLFGMLVYRRGIFQHPEAHRAHLKKAFVIGAVTGIPASIGATYVMHLAGGPPSGPPSALHVASFPLMIFGRPLLSMCYASGLALLFLNPAWRARLLPFSVIGRTALSNYLFQTIFCTTIFFGYGGGALFGGGLYARVHLIPLFILSILIYALEVPLSRWWLAHHRFGPAEWAWRSLTYRRLQPMKL